MTPDELARVQGAYARALELPAGEREEFLRATFPDEARLREEVRELLQYSEPGDSFLDTPLISRFIPPPPHEFPPDRVGPYELVRELGRGGTAAVYLARRADDLYRKEVAVKILNRFGQMYRNRFGVSGTGSTIYAES